MLRTKSDGFQQVGNWVEGIQDGENITIYPDGTQEFGYYRYGLKDKRRKKTWVEEVKRVADAKKHRHAEEINKLFAFEIGEK